MKLFGGRNLRSIKPAEIEKFKDIRATTKTIHNCTRQLATVLRDLSVISKIFAIAVKNDFVEYNPCSRIEKPQFDNVQDKVLDPKDEAKFFAAFKSDWARDVCIAVLNSGLRQNDILGLAKKDIDWNYKVLRLIQGKTKRKIVTPMNQTLQNLIRSRLKSEYDLVFLSPKKLGKKGGSVKKAISGLAVGRKPLL